MGYEGPGVYKHYKGGLYGVLGLALREESKEDGWVTEVIYWPMTMGSMLEEREEMFWSRMKDDFDTRLLVPPAEITSLGLRTAQVPRFQKLDDEEARIARNLNADDIVEAWHEGRLPHEHLHEALRWSWTEYRHWVFDSKALPAIGPGRA